ncbi:MAG: hypothetical protein GY921_10705 [Phycisphaeraceae bacterium]|nr:hypothetical protein [Phycisphaeraceae bacterium]MCP4939645.1 hypothetical protein [Phycisphaeraceae bacterium]
MSDSSTPLHFRLEIPGLPEMEPMLREFASRAIALADVDGTRHDALLDALVSAVSLVEREITDGGDDPVDLSIGVVIDAAAIEFAILEKGVPLGDDDLEAPGHAIPEQIRPARVFDRLWWVQRGPEGSELHLRAHRDHAAIHVLEAVQARIDQDAAEADHAKTAPSASTAAYRIRDYRPGDGLEVARRIYESYGHSYPNPDLYYPDRVDALNANGRIKSIICETDDGDFVGHYALERPDLGPIGEAGQAVIDHAHRGHGLMRPMRAAVESAGDALELLGIWSQPTARHPFSQKMNLGFGSTASALCLGTTPAGTSLRGGVGGSDGGDDRSRHSCFLYWHPLREETAITAFVPAAIAELIAKLYVARGRSAAIETEGEDGASDAGELHVRFDAARAVGRIELDRIGAASIDAVRSALLVMESAAHAAVVFIDLPIDDPGCGRLATRLLDDGCRLAGIGPRFRRTAEGGEDVLRLQRILAPVDEAGIVVEGDLGRELASLILGRD